MSGGIVISLSAPWESTIYITRETWVWSSALQLIPMVVYETSCLFFLYLKQIRGAMKIKQEIMDVSGLV